MEEKLILNVPNEIKISIGTNENTGGTANHNELKNLDFESSGHTGFQKELTIDSELSDASTNPIQNKAVFENLTGKSNLFPNFSLCAVSTATSEYGAQHYNITSLGGDGRTAAHLLSEETIRDLFQLKPVFYSTSESEVTVIMKQNQNALMGILTSLTLTAPEAVNTATYESWISFKSGTTATVFTDNTGFTFVGDDVSADGVFTPQANKGYELAAKTLGPHGVVVRVGAF